MLLPLHLNLDAGAPAPAPAPDPVDKGRDAGSPWWGGEWIIPGVTHYLPEKPPEDVTPLKPKIEEAKERLKKAKPPKADSDYRKLIGRLTSLYRSVEKMERRAAQIIEDRATEAAIAKVVAEYRELAERRASLDKQIQFYEAQAARAAQEEADRQERLRADDERALEVIQGVLDEMDETRNRRRRLWQILQPFNEE